jgi:hypothetical protein
MNECIQHTHQRILVIAQELHRHLTCNPKDTFNSCYTEAIDEVLGETKRNALWCFQGLSLKSRCIILCTSIRGETNRPSRKDSWSQHGPHPQYCCQAGCFHSAYLPVYPRKIDVSDVKVNDVDQITHPRMNPTIDMTAAVRPYVNRLASHAVGSGNVSINQSWKTGGNL